MEQGEEDSMQSMHKAGGGFGKGRGEGEGRKKKDSLKTKGIEIDPWAREAVNCH